MKLLPQSAPSLSTDTVPPCISVIFRARARPMPSPPSSRSRLRSPWTKRSNTRRQHFGKQCRCRCRGPRARRNHRRAGANEDFAAIGRVLGCVRKQVGETCSMRAGSTSSGIGSGQISSASRVIVAGDQWPRFFHRSTENRCGVHVLAVRVESCPGRCVTHREDLRSADLGDLPDGR